MSDYTPTTEDVRYRYIDYREKEGDYTPGEFAWWLAAHDAEVRASVLAEQGEPEWEYGVYDPATNEVDECGPGPVTRDSFTGIDWEATGEFIVHRRPAGSWLPVEENGENS